jgi:RND family efflux transporter MFP subunit
MKTKILAGFLAALLIAGGYYLLQPHLKKEPLSTAPSVKAEAKRTAKPERKILYWTDPMMPNYRAKGPGQSPMGMELVPVYEEESAEGVKITDDTARNIGLRTEKISIRRISRLIKASGSVSYDERKVANIQSKVSGWVDKLYVNFTGQKVKKGDHLLEIYSPDLVATEEEFLLSIKNRIISTEGEAHDAQSMGDAMYDAARKRLQYFDVPEHQISELEKNGRVFKTLHLHSPFDGVLVSKQVFAGMQVQPGMTLYTVADLSKVWVQADVYEHQIGWVKVGDPVTMTLPAWPGRKFTGHVRYINPFLEKETRTVKVRMEFDNPSLELKPEMYADIEINTGAHNGLAVPQEAVIRGGKRDLVIVHKKDGIYAPMEVKIGVEGDKYIEVVKGLRPGDMVVTSAQFLIDSESNLHDAVAKMKDAGEKE